jgi:ataxin-10
MKVALGSPLLTRPTSIHGYSFGIAFATTRVLTQMLSNLVTGNQELLDQFWSAHMNIPEEQSVLM